MFACAEKKNIECAATGTISQYAWVKTFEYDSLETCILSEGSTVFILKSVSSILFASKLFSQTMFPLITFPIFFLNFVFSLHFQTFAFKSAAFDYQLHTYKMSAITISIYKLGIKLLTITWYWEARTNRYLLSIDRSFVCLHTCSRTHLKTAIHESWIS